MLEPGGPNCNLIVTGSAVTPTCVSAAPPPATGGPVTNGRYVLTAQTFYGWSVSGCPEPISMEWRVCGSQWEFASLQIIGDSGAEGVGYGNSDVSLDASTMTIQETCPSTGSPYGQSYSATATTLTIYTPQTASITEVDTFTRM